MSLSAKLVNITILHLSIFVIVLDQIERIDTHYTQNKLVFNFCNSGILARTQRFGAIIGENLKKVQEFYIFWSSWVERRSSNCAKLGYLFFMSTLQIKLNN